MEFVVYTASFISSLSCSNFYVNAKSTKSKFANAALNVTLKIFRFRPFDTVSFLDVIIHVIFFCFFKFSFLIFIFYFSVLATYYLKQNKLGERAKQQRTKKIQKKQCGSTKHTCTILRQPHTIFLFLLRLKFLYYYYLILQKLYCFI